MDIFSFAVRNTLNQNGADKIGHTMQNPEIDLSGAKVLIVDDMPANLDVIYKSLRTEGYQVLAATDGETALKVIEEERPDLVLLDVMMPGMDGFEVCRRLKAHPELQHIPVIFLTGLNEDSDVVQCYRVGGIDYVSKPFRQEEVLVRVRTHLERVFLARALAAEIARREG